MGKVKIGSIGLSRGEMLHSHPHQNQIRIMRSFPDQKSRSRHRRIKRNIAMNPNKALWEKGDFTRIAQSMRESGEALVNSLGISKGHKVLDLGCGDGTTALPEAKLGADVLGVDIPSNLVAAGNKRPNCHGRSNSPFPEDYASNLHHPQDHTLDPPP